jgi:hypothetical protein
LHKCYGLKWQSTYIKKKDSYTKLKITNFTMYLIKRNHYGSRIGTNPGVEHKKTVNDKEKLNFAQLSGIFGI